MSRSRLTVFSVICILSLVFQLPLFTPALGAGGQPVRERGAALVKKPAQAPAVPAGDRRLPPAEALQGITGAPISPDDSNFIADTGGNLDQYLFRTDVPDGRLRFEIPITRYYFTSASQIQFDADGFLTSSAAAYVKEKKILPATAHLEMRVFDVDEDAEWCPEVDLVYVNGKAVLKNGAQARLTGANDTWSSFSVDVPIELLKFPRTKGSNAAPAKTNNEIAVRIDASNCTTIDGNPAWAVTVDYGHLSINSPVRPVVFAHGWTGTTDTFDYVEERLDDDGIQTAGQANLMEGLYAIPYTADELSKHIRRSTLEFGVDKVNVLAHSKGGLVTRRALYGGGVPTKVENVVTYDSPHHGTQWAESIELMTVICAAKYPLNPLNAALCLMATQEFRRDTVRMFFNYSGCLWLPIVGWFNCRPIWVKAPGVEYHSFTATSLPIIAVYPHETTTYPWDANTVPFPSELKVDATFNSDHGGILERDDAYKCALHLLDSSRYSCPSAAAAQASAEPALERTLLSQAVDLAAGAAYTTTLLVDAAGLLQVDFLAPEAVTFTLVEPGGRVINPALAVSDPAIEFGQALEYGVPLSSYRITSPAAGAWQAQMVSPTGQSGALLARSDAGARLDLGADQTGYQPGATMTFQAALVSGGAALPGATLSGAVWLPDNSQQALTWHDDGLNGDTAAGDGIFTARLAAPDIKGGLRLAASASLGLVQREVSLTFPVSPQTASIGAVQGATTPDENLNGFYDSLTLDVGINVLASGHFDLQALLVDGAGDPVAAAQASSRSQGETPWAPGAHSLTLIFDGHQIWEHGVNGPYKLTGLLLSDTSAEVLPVDSADDLYTTSAYSAGQFEHPLLYMESGQEQTSDPDGNGRFDSLTIQLQVYAALAGTYHVNGRLVDSQGDEIAWSSSVFDAFGEGSYKVNLVYIGSEIGYHGVNGPYTLEDVSIYRSDGGVLVTLPLAYTTQAYSFTQFEQGFYRIYMPSSMHTYDNLARVTIAGTVTFQGSASPGELVNLRLWDGSSMVDLGDQWTDSSGKYQIDNLPLLLVDQSYYVRWSNPANDPTRLGFYTCYVLSEAMNPGSYPCSFDVSDIVLSDPTPGSAITLPRTFYWQKRSVTSDSYEFDLADMSDNQPWFWSPQLGYTNAYTLSALPTGFSNNVEYGWFVWVYGDQGYGASFYYHTVTFTSAISGAAPQVVIGEKKPLSAGQR